MSPDGPVDITIVIRCRDVDVWMETIWPFLERRLFPTPEDVEHDGWGVTQLRTGDAIQEREP